LARRDRNVFTIMIVPHAETKVFTFRLSTIAFQALCYALVCLFLFMIILARSYQTMVSNMWELQELRLVNREQRDQIEQLVQETTSLEQRMTILDELDKQVREMMELQSYRGGSSEGSSVAASSPPALQRSGSEVTIASATPPGAATAIGGPTLPATAAATVVSRAAISQARNALGTLGQINLKLGDQTKSLEEIRSALSESLAYLFAKPSGYPAFGYISSRFGYRNTMYGGDFHTGYDIAGRYGSPILATADGTVVFAGWAGTYGNMVEVEHAYGWSTVYGHCVKLAVKVGDRVKRGQVVGFIGSTGKSTGPHVHYEVRINGRAVNPRYYLPGS